MDRKRALELLGLAPDATAKDIEKQFKILAGSSHPDLKGGSTDRMRELLMARDTLRRTMPLAAIARRQTNTALIVRQLAALQEAKDEARSRGDAATKSITIAATAPLRTSKRIFTVTSGMSAAMWFFADRGGDLLGSMQMSPNYSTLITRMEPILIMYGAVTALMAWTLSGRISDMEARIEQLGEHLSRRSRWWSLASNIVPDDMIISLDDLVDRIAGSSNHFRPPLFKLMFPSSGGVPVLANHSDLIEEFRFVARHAGPLVAADLFVAKGLQLETLRESTQSPDSSTSEWFEVVRDQPRG